MADAGVIAALADRGAAAFGALVGRVKLARLSQVEIDGRVWVRKQRLQIAAPLLWLGRAYARCLTVPVEFLDLATWQRWEEAIHAAAAVPSASERHGLRLPLLPGRPLAEILVDPRTSRPLCHRALQAALVALRGLHRRAVAVDGRLVLPSHGDASVRNVLYDPASDAARWIDFEIRHPLALDVALRRADDLRTLLFSAAACLPVSQVPLVASCLCAAYDDPPVHDALLRLLARDRARWLFGTVQAPIDRDRRVALTAALTAAVRRRGGR